jgi:hypothetical protein
VVGGWALDLWRGEQTRAHADIEIAIPRACFAAMRNHLWEFKLFSVGDGLVNALPDNEEPPLDRHQNWVLDECASAWRLDIFLEPSDAETWIYRRNESLRASRPRMVGISSNGVPYLRPQGILLFKAKALRDKDDRDFAACVPLMRDEDRLWLKQALNHTHPDHPWISRLG